MRDLIFTAAERFCLNLSPIEWQVIDGLADQFHTWPRDLIERAIARLDQTLTPGVSVRTFARALQNALQALQHTRIGAQTQDHASEATTYYRQLFTHVATGIQEVAPHFPEHQTTIAQILDRLQNAINTEDWGDAVLAWDHFVKTVTRDALITLSRRDLLIL